MSVGAINKSTGERIPAAGMPAIDAALSGLSTNPVQNKVVKEAFDEIKDGQSIDSFADVETALDEKADTDIVASDFSAAVSYTAGDYCIYDGKFYKFKNSHSGAWSASDVDEIKIAGELASLKSGLTSVSSLLNIVSTGKITIRSIYATGKTFAEYLADMSENEMRIFTFINMTDDIDGLTEGLCIANRLGGYSPNSVQCLAINNTTIKAKRIVLT